MALRPRYAAAGVAGLVYAIGQQWLLPRLSASPWNTVMLAAPLLALVALAGWRDGRRSWSLLAAIGLALLALQAARGGSVVPDGLYVAEHVGFHLVLALWFGLTLRAGSRPLIARLADRVHHLTPAMERYTRSVTVAWTLYFCAVAAASALLSGLLPFATWAVLAYAVTPCTLAAMFIGEYLLRYRLHPEFERATMRDAVRAFLQHTGDHGPSRPPPAPGPAP